MMHITRIISEIEAGDTGASERLLPLVYDELRKLASSKLGKEKPGQTLQATALVHEAFLRLVHSEQSVQWNGRAHFFGAAAHAMKRILIENARRKQRLRHGGEWQRQDLEEANVVSTLPDEELLALDDALTRLNATDPEKAELIHLRFFAGLTTEQAAEVLGISPTTAKRHWRFARMWLHREVRPED